MRKMAMFLGAALVLGLTSLGCAVEPPDDESAFVEAEDELIDTARGALQAQEDYDCDIHTSGSTTCAVCIGMTSGCIGWACTNGNNGSQCP